MLTYIARRLLYSIVVLVAAIVFNLVADILYGLLDPRVRYT